MPKLAPPSTDTATAADRDERNQLIELAQAGRVYEFLDQSYRYLSHTQSDPEIVLLTLQGLVRLGLGGPARELLQARGDLQGEVDVQELRQSVVPIATGRVPWSRFDEQAQRNITVLLRLRPELAPLAASLRDSCRELDLFQTTEDQYQLSERPAGSLRQWRPGLMDHRPVAEMDLRLALGGPAPVVAGIAMNALIERVYHATAHEPGAEAMPVYIVDPDIRRLAAWLHIEDRAELLADGRVHFFIGPDALQYYEQLLTTNEDLTIPGVHLCANWAPELGKEIEAIGQRRTAHRNETFVQLAVSHEQRAQQRDGAYWAERLQPGARILGFTSRFTTMLQYSMRDIGHALTELGYEFDLSIETADYRTHTTLTTSRTIHETDPALVIMLNHFRSERAVSLGSVPVLTWIQDPTDLVFSHKTGEALGPLDFVCGYYFERCTEEFGYPASRFFSAPVPVSTRIFHDEPVDPELAKNYTCDVMYVGHLHDTAEEHLAKWHDSTPPEIHPLLDQLLQEVHALHERGDNLEFRQTRPLVKERACAMGYTLCDDDLEQIANFFTYRLYDILFRRQTLLWAAQWADRTGRTFKLYGKGWARDPLLGQYAVGPVEHGEDLRCAYRCAKLCLQTIAGGYSHQRTFEALTSGSLAIGRYVPTDFGRLSLEEYARRDLADGPVDGAVKTFPSLANVLFRDAEEFARVAELYIDNDERYEQIQHEFAAIVDRDLTYKRVVKDLLDQIRNAMLANTT